MKDDPLYDNILEMYKGLCIICGMPYNSIHEIIPKSLTKNWNTLYNRVPLCMEHHEWAHHRGTRHSASELRKYQEIRLKQLYGNTR